MKATLFSLTIFFFFRIISEKEFDFTHRKLYLYPILDRSSSPLANLKNKPVSRINWIGVKETSEILQSLVLRGRGKRARRRGRAEKLPSLKGARPDNAANQRAVSIRATKHRRSIKVNLRPSVIKRFRCTFVYLSVVERFQPLLSPSPVEPRGRRGRLNPPPPPPR